MNLRRQISWTSESNILLSSALNLWRECPPTSPTHQFYSTSNDKMRDWELLVGDHPFMSTQTPKLPNAQPTVFLYLQPCWQAFLKWAENHVEDRGSPHHVLGEGEKRRVFCSIVCYLVVSLSWIYMKNRQSRDTFFTLDYLELQKCQYSWRCNRCSSQKMFRQ